MNVKKLSTRYFAKTDGKNFSELPKVADDMSHKKVQDFFVSSYPTLLNAQIVEMGIAKDESTGEEYYRVEFRTIAGTKG